MTLVFPLLHSRHSNRTVSVLALLGGGLALAAQTPPTPIFQIGTFDRSSGEFIRGLPAPGFAYRTSVDTSRSWPGEEGAATDRDASTSSAQSPTVPPHRILFRTEASATCYRLRIAALFENPSVPSLIVGVNGTQGEFFFEPTLDYENGDSAGPFDPIYSHADLEVDIPRGLLRAGENEITLAAKPAPGRTTGGSGFSYDALSLVAIASGPKASRPIVRPTILYQHHGSGLAEEVEVLFPSYSLAAASSQVELAVGDSEFHLPAGRSSSFGQQRLMFAVTDPAALSHTQLRWQSPAGPQSASYNLQPAKRWTLLLAPLVHLDIGFTGSRAEVAAIHSRNIDDTIALAAKYPGFRFNIDGAWPLENYLADRTPKRSARALQMIRAGRLSLPAQYANLLTGFPTSEVLIRSLYPSAKLAREYHLPFNYANITDVPSYSWSYASVLASAGIKNFVAAANNFRAPVLLQGHLNEMSPFFWEGPDGQRVLMWYSRHYEQMRYLFGINPDPTVGRETIPLFLQQYQRPAYTSSSVIVYGSQLENTDLDPAHASLASAWNKDYAFPHLEYSSLSGALERVRAETTSPLPVIRGDGGPYWEEGILSSAAAAAMERENERRAPAAETLSTLAAFAAPGTQMDKRTADSMWRHMLLMDEHTVTLSPGVNDPTRPGVISELEEKNSFASQAHFEVEQLITTALSTLGSAQRLPPRSIFVANSLNWARDGIVEADISPNEHLVDPDSGRELPAEELFRGKAFVHVRFIARRVPALGTRSYPLAAGKPSQATASQSAQGTVLESPFYRITVEPSTGSVASIFDKQLGKELVDIESPYRFGSYLYVTGGAGADTRMQQYRTMAPVAPLTINGPMGGVVTQHIHAVDSEGIRMATHALHTPSIQTEVRLSLLSKRIDISYTLEKEYTTEKEGVYFAFPFAQRNADFQYDVQTAPVRAAKDIYPGGGHEWFSVQNWAASSGNGFTAVLMPKDTFLMSFGDIVRGQWPTSMGERPGTLLPYVMANYRNVGHPAGEGGTFHFNYAITSAATLDTASVSKEAWSEVTPLEATLVERPSWMQSTSPAATVISAPLQIGDDFVLLSTWKEAEDGEGTVLRLLDLKGSRRQILIRGGSTPMQDVWLADSVERPIRQIAVSSNSFSLEMLPYQSITVRLNRVSQNTSDKRNQK